MNAHLPGETREETLSQGGGAIALLSGGDERSDLAFDAPATAHWQTARIKEADNIDVGPLTEADLQDNLFGPSNVPF